MHEIDKVIAACRSVIDAGSRGVLVTVVRTQGSTYRRAGARAVIGEDGTLAGAISGGCLERDIAERVAMWLADMNPRLVTYDSTRGDDLIFGLGLGCRGVLDLLIEPFDAAHLPRLVTGFQWNGVEPAEWTTILPNGETMIEILRPPRAVAIFGGGDAEPVAQFARTVGWRVNVVKPRAEFDAGAFDAAVVMTHNFARDADILRQLLASQIQYIGLLGPKSRGDELLAEIGASREPRLHSPIGLDLGGETPEEIALSIVAEIQAAFERRSARSLRELKVPIHETVDKPACA
ncbi:MAG: xanthine dehydrogenase accessory factor [Thermoanaerobaculia bacterium]|jgi:xanthine/CO dehydrogenase XdhC/CoxF family maturation factor|nr:xanthine dehydrogenase accessory factor [Thermoanaerobaculia bacterium]